MDACTRTIYLSPRRLSAALSWTMNREWCSSSKIVLGIDIGTTYSAVSFAYLIEGERPKIQRVIKWPGQLSGAQAANDDEVEEIVDTGCTLVKHFKLHLHPKRMAPSGGFELDVLPNDVTVGRIYSDFLRYMLEHTKSFFQKEVFEGPQVWDKHSSSMEIVVTHPNGWGIHEQAELRAAAIQAGLVPDSNSASRIKFLSEAEASIHFCINSLNLQALVEPESKLLVCDAGGSTVDATVYNVESTNPKLRLKEVKASACVQAGSIFVDKPAEKFIRTKLERAEIIRDDVDEYTKTGANEFRSKVKPEYTGRNETMSITVGRKSFNRPHINVTNGRMRLQGSEIKTFFDPCVDQIVQVVESQAQGVTSPHIFLVGGFGDSPYLQKSLKERLGDSRHLTTNNQPGAKAVADGAVIWAIDQSVVSRATRYSYGLPVVVRHNRGRPEHANRVAITDPRGERVILGGWSEIVGQGEVMDTESAVKMPYYRPYSGPLPTLSDFSVLIFSTTHPADTEFMMDEEGDILPGFYPVCQVSADLQALEGNLSRKSNSAVGTYWELHFRVCIQFADTELKAYVEWVDKNGNTRTGAAKAIPAALV
ncbi:hypothetical protein FRC09_011349 [Ceratobasidium sp. 395]|nr:hypothetical protein FRC09_011349 [Ceratobasidium sp. 395]